MCIFSNVLQHLLMKYATDTHRWKEQRLERTCALCSGSEWCFVVVILWFGSSGRCCTPEESHTQITAGLSGKEMSKPGEQTAVTLTPMSVCHWALWHLRFWNPSYIQQTCGWAEAVRLTLSQGKCDTIMKWRWRQGVGKECYISLGFRQPLLVTKF